MKTSLAVECLCCKILIFIKRMMMNASRMSHIKFCAGCKTEIRDLQFLLALDKYWHESCLKCSECGIVLEQVGNSFFVKGTSILCRNDYTRLYGRSRVCAACGQQIPAFDKVLRSRQRVYHVTCFACAACKRELKTGDRYYDIDGRIVCEHDGHAYKKQDKLKAK